MNDMEESRKFENAFKNAFDEAGVDPSENVWTNIELDLARAEGGEMKRRLLFYKLLAAASVTFAMCVAGVGYYIVQKSMYGPGLVAVNDQSLNAPQIKQPANATPDVQDQENQATQQTKNSGEQRSSTDGNTSKNLALDLKSLPAEHTVKSADNSSRTPATIDYAGDKDNRTALNTTTTTAGLSKGVNLHEQRGVTDASGNSVEIQTLAEQRFENDLMYSPIYTSLGNGALRVQHKLPKVISADAIAITPLETQPDPLALMLARLDDKEKEMQAKDKADKKNNASEKLWTSVGFSAGGFSSVTSGGSLAASSSRQSFAANKVADRQAKASGTAYSVGVSMGTRLSDKWVLQGGVNYMAQSSDYTSSAVVSADYQTFYSGSLNEVKSADKQFLNSAPYSVNNNVQFVSVPVQAGYLIVDKRFGIQMNAGVATDLFLQNTITPESDVLPKKTQGRGEDSPYRPVNFSGLLGTEFSYRLGEHYRMAVNPAIRYPFNSIYKSELGIESMPLTFDVGLKFRYIFH